MTPVKKYPVLADFLIFQNKAFSSILNTSANHQTNQEFYGSKSKLGQCKLKAIPIFKIKYLAFMIQSIKQDASLTHPAFNFRNKDGQYTHYQRIPLSNCEPMPEHCGTHCHTVWYILRVNLVSIGTSLVELGVKDLV